MIYFELFYTFFLIGLFTFGGGYAMIPLIQERVLAKSWLTMEQIQDFIAISEMTPGPFALNISTFIGSITGGPLGAAIATFGVILPSFIIIILVAFILKKVLSNRFVQGALKGVRPIVLALILLTVITFIFNALFIKIDNKIISFDRKSFIFLLVLFIYRFIYNKFNKKSLNVFAILGLSALLGLIIF